MLAVLDFLISGFLLWIAAKVFPGVIIIAGWLPLIICTVIFCASVAITLAITILFMVPGYRRNVSVRTILVICTVIASIVGALMLRYVCTLIAGFTVASFWAALLVSMAACFIVILPRIRRQ
jgi:hypothetical protein